MADIKGLDRFDLADLREPRALARKIHGLLGSMTGPVPAVQIARSLDISEVYQERFDGFAGMLLTDRRRSDGKILANTAHGDRLAAQGFRSPMSWVTS